MNAVRMGGCGQNCWLFSLYCGTLSIEIMSGSYLDGKIVDELRLPERCVIINVHRDRENLPPKGQTLMPGDQVQIEMDSQDIEKLYEPLVSMANIY